MNESIQSIIDQHMPRTKLTNKQKVNYKKPWMTFGLMTSRTKKFDLLKKAKITGDPDCYSEYKQYLNIYTKLKFEARNDFYRNKAASFGQNKSKLWQLINEIAKRKRKTNSSLKTIKNKDGKKSLILFLLQTLSMIISAQ